MRRLGTVACAASPGRIAGGAEGAAAFPTPEGHPRGKALHVSVVEPDDPRLLRRGRDARLDRARHVAGAGADRSRIERNLLCGSDRLRAELPLAEQAAEAFSDLG